MAIYLEMTKEYIPFLKIPYDCILFLKEIDIIMSGEQRSINWMFAISCFFTITVHGLSETFGSEQRHCRYTESVGSHKG